MHQEVTEKRALHGGKEREGEVKGYMCVHVYTSATASSWRCDREPTTIAGSNWGGGRREEEGRQGERQEGNDAYYILHYYLSHMIGGYLTQCFL